MRSIMLSSVIRIHRIYIFLGLPDPLIRCMDPGDPATKIVRKTYCYVTSFGLFVFNLLKTSFKKY
jgi:hypothetical protein